MLNKEKIILGSAQWGSNYGVTNKKGKTSSLELEKILNFAKSNGTNIIDTAMSYGNAEEVLGKFDLNEFKIFTKTLHFQNSIIGANEIDLFKNSFYNSLRKLNLKNIEGLFIHRATDLLKEDSHLLINEFKELKDKGLIKKIGISIYDPYILDNLFELFIPDVIQFPFNIFDQRMVKNSLINRLKEKNIQLQARSIFLQGVLLAEFNKLPKYFYKWKSLFEKWDNLCLSNNMTKLEAAISYVSNQKKIDNYVLGFENLAQLRACFKIKTSKKILLSDSKINNLDLVDPRKWII